MSKYVREGLGKQWYETLLDIVGEAGATIVEGQGGKAAGDAVRGFHKGWTQAAFGSGNKGATASAPPPRPMPAPQPRYFPPRPAPPPRPQPMPRPSFVPQLSFMPHALPPSVVQPLTLPPKSSSTTRTVLIVGGIGLGAAAIYLLARGHR